MDYYGGGDDDEDHYCDDWCVVMTMVNMTMAILPGLGAVPVAGGTCSIRSIVNRPNVSREQKKRERNNWWSLRKSAKAERSQQRRVGS